jgi:CRISPR-associated protein Csm4
MAYQWLEVSIRPLGHFTAALKGDTLFGQLCWHIIEQWGESKLTELLEGYLEGQPFMVVSDAFPTGFFPRPTCPLAWIGLDFSNDQVARNRKQYKAKRWLHHAAFSEPMHHWHNHLYNEAECMAMLLSSAAENNDTSAHQKEDKPRKLQYSYAQHHNSINRLTGTTGEGYAPYTVTRHLYRAPQLAIYLLYDDNRMDADEIKGLFAWMGRSGFGRDASVGSGRFEVVEAVPWQPPHEAQSDTVMTLAPCSVEPGIWDVSRSAYEPFVRFGRHGHRLAVSSNPFKNPVLMLDTAAILSAASEQPGLWVGRGLGGAAQPLSKVEKRTVCQGYAPVVPVQQLQGETGQGA